MSTTQVKFALVPGGKAPVRATAGAAAVDLYARVDKDTPNAQLGWNDDQQREAWGVRLDDWRATRIDLGVRLAIPEGHVGLLFPRSSCSDHNYMMANCVGVIDSDYRGTVKAPLRAVDDSGAHIVDGQRVAQLLVLKLPTVEFVEVDALDSTERGEGGFGSSGR